MNETVYASDLCKFYIENKYDMDRDYRVELYKQIYDDLFGNTNKDIFQPIIGGYSFVDFNNNNTMIMINCIGFYCDKPKYLNFSKLKSFVKRDNYYYYDLKYGKINVDFYESLMEKIEMLNSKNTSQQ